MKKCVRQLSFLFVLTIIGITATAQSYNSPYSRFGLGDFTNQNFMAVRGMGNTGSSYANGTTMNPVNPASYSWLNLTTYNVGLFAELSQIKDNKYSERKWTGNLEYGGLAFPLRNFKNEILDPSKKKYKLGMAFFLRPYTRVNYDVTTQETIQDIGIVERRFFGTGGTYNVGWGNSIKFGNFSAGLNLGYLFGQINNNQNIFLTEDASSFQDRIRLKYSLRSFIYDVGFLYKLNLNKEVRENNKTIPEKYLMFGLRGNAGSNFKTSGEFSYDGVGKLIGDVDTIDNSSLEGTGKIPAVIGLGVTYFEGRKYNIGAEFEYSPFSSFTNSIRSEQDFRDVMKVSVGGQFTPDARGFGTFLERTSYLFGAYFNQDSRIIQGKNVNNYGITLGMAMPFYYQQNFSNVNVTFELGQRGAGSVISENFIQMGVGINFNDDSWFIRRKYN